MKSNADDAFGHEETIPFEMPQVLTLTEMDFVLDRVAAGSSGETDRRCQNGVSGDESGNKSSKCHQTTTDLSFFTRRDRA